MNQNSSRIESDASMASNGRQNYRKITVESKKLLLNLVNNQGFCIKDAAEQLDIKYSSARNLIANENKKSDATIDDVGLAAEPEMPPNPRGAPGKLNAEILNIIENIIEEDPGATLKWMKVLLETRHQISLSTSTIDNALKRLKITMKSSSKVLDRVNAEDTLIKRQEYADMFTREAPENMDNCIFIDESGFNLHLRRNKARSRIGTRAPIVIPAVRGRNMSLIVADNKSRTLHYKVITDGTCNSVKFAQFLSELFIIIRDDPLLHGSWIIMDNAKIHSRALISDICSQSGCVLKYLSPYSYMLDPVENIFSKIKLYVRSRLTFKVGWLIFPS